MRTGAKLAGATAILMALGAAALAAGNHGHDGQGASRAQGPGAGNQGPGAGNHDMMKMMMRMHTQMMGGSGPRSGMAMMGSGDPMSGMGLQRFDADGDGTVTSQEAHEGLQALLGEYDADGDEVLSLAEFETLHSALRRESMVDRFQFLDDDGDGAVTVAEIVKPADMMERMQTMRDGMMPGPNGGMMGDNGMQGNRGMMGSN